MKERRADKQSEIRPREVRLLNCLVYGSTISKKILFALLVLTPCLATPSGGVDAGYSPQMLIAAWYDVNRKTAHYNGVREGDEFTVGSKGQPYHLIAAWYTPPSRETMGVFSGPAINYLFTMKPPPKNSPPLEYTMLIFTYAIDNFQTVDHDHWCGKDLVPYFAKLPRQKNTPAFQNVVYALCSGQIMLVGVPGDQKTAKSILVPTDHDLTDNNAYKAYSSHLPQASFEDYSIDSGEQLPGSP